MLNRPDTAEQINGLLASEEYQLSRHLPEITDEEESLCREKARVILAFTKKSRYAMQSEAEKVRVVRELALLLKDELGRPFVLPDGSTRPVDLRLVPWIFDLQQQLMFFEEKPDELVRAKEATARFFADGRRFSFQRWLEFIASGRVAARYRAEGRLN